MSLDNKTNIGIRSEETATRAMEAYFLSLDCAAEQSYGGNTPRSDQVEIYLSDKPINLLEILAKN